MRFILEKDIIKNIEVKHVGRYYHKYAFDVNIVYNDSYWQYDYEDIKDEYNISEKDFDSIDEKIDDVISRKNNVGAYAPDTFYYDITTMNGELEDFGYSCINYYDYKESVSDLMGDYEYLEDGSVYYE